MLLRLLFLNINVTILKVSQHLLPLTRLNLYS